MACPECRDPVTYMSGLAEHLHTHHGWETAMHCAECGFGLTHRDARLHFRTHHPEAIPRLQCSCGDKVLIVINQKDNIGKHMEQVHGIRRCADAGFELVQPLRKPVSISDQNVPAVDLGGGCCSVCHRFYDPAHLRRCHFIGPDNVCALTVVEASK